MRAICVDDETLVLALTVDLCREVPELSEVKGFEDASEALAWVSENDTDIAFVDIYMPRMNGLELSMKLKEIRPDIAIVFLTSGTDRGRGPVCPFTEQTGCFCPYRDQDLWRI